MIPIILNELGTMPKSFKRDLKVLEIRLRIEIIQTSALLKLAIILRRVLETRGDLQLLRFQGKTVCKPGSKKETLEEYKNNNRPRRENKKAKYLDLARELNILWNKRMTVIPIIAGAPGTVHKGSEKYWKSEEGLGIIEIRSNT